MGGAAPGGKAATPAPGPKGRAGGEVEVASTFLGPALKSAPPPWDSRMFPRVAESDGLISLYLRRCELCPWECSLWWWEPCPEGRPLGRGQGVSLRRKRLGGKGLPTMVRLCCPQGLADAPAAGRTDLGQTASGGAQSRIGGPERQVGGQAREMVQGEAVGSEKPVSPKTIQIQGTDKQDGDPRFNTGPTLPPAPNP